MAASVTTGYRGIDQNYNYSSYERSQLLSNLGEASAFSSSGTFHSIGMNLENNQKFQSSNNNERHEKSSKTHSRGERLLRTATQVRIPEAPPRYEERNLLSKQQHLYGSIENASTSSYSYGACSSRGDLSRSADYVSIPIAPERTEQSGFLPQQHEQENFYSAASSSSSSSNSLASPPPSLEKFLALGEAAKRERILQASAEKTKKRCCRANTLGCFFTNMALVGFSMVVTIPVFVEGDSNARIFGAVWMSILSGLCIFSCVAQCSLDGCCKKVNNFVCDWLRSWNISDEEERVISHHQMPCICRGLCDCDEECKYALESFRR